MKMCFFSLLIAAFLGTHAFAAEKSVIQCVSEGAVIRIEFPVGAQKFAVWQGDPDLPHEKGLPLTITSYKLLRNGPNTVQFTATLYGVEISGVTKWNAADQLELSYTISGRDRAETFRSICN